MKNLVLTTLLVISVTEAYIPTYITPCSKSDPNLQECALENGRKAIPYIVKGDKTLQLRPLEPFSVPEIKIDSNGLNIRLKDAVLSGFSRVQLQYLKLDLDKQYFQLEIFCPRFDLEGTYNVSGQILIVPITGQGHLQASMYEVNVKYAFTFELILKDGKQFVKPNRPDVSFNGAKSFFNLENLFNGDKRLGEATNKFLNENHDILVQEFEPSISQTVSAIAEDIVVKILTSVPYDEVLLP